jgi:hypothetical protein
MKQLLTFFAITILFGCTKEKISEPPTGTWTIVKTDLGDAGGIQIQTFTPSSEITLEFGKNGSLLLTGANPGNALSPLWEYDSYQILEDDIIRFYQRYGNKEVQAYFSIEGNLYLNYLHLRCPYEEEFLRIK